MLVYIVIVILVLVLLVSGKTRVLCKGFINLFVTNIAKTPEGAEAVYLEAIEKSQSKYNSADNHMRMIAGQLDTEDKELKGVDSRIKYLEASCQSLVKTGQLDKAKILSEERNLKLQEKEGIEIAISKLNPALVEAKEVAKHYEDKLRQLKTEKTTVIGNMKLDRQMSEMYDDMDDLKNDSEIDRLLSAVKDGSKETREKAVGAKLVHEGKTSTQVLRIESEVLKTTSDDYIEHLKEEYGRKDKS